MCRQSMPSRRWITMKMQSFLTCDLVCKWRPVRHVNPSLYALQPACCSGVGGTEPRWCIFLRELHTLAADCTPPYCIFVHFPVHPADLTGRKRLQLPCQWAAHTCCCVARMYSTSRKKIWYLHLWKRDTVFQPRKIKPTPRPQRSFDFVTLWR